MIKLWNKSKNKKAILIIGILLIIIGILSYYFVSNNEEYYKKTIVKITYIDKESTHLQDINNQNITAIIMNGNHKGEKIILENSTSFAGLFDQEYNLNDEIFVSIKENENGMIISSRIDGYKRDKYLAYVVILFVLLILLVGRAKGFRSLASVIVNILLFCCVIRLYLYGYNLFLVTSIMNILFIVISIFIVSGYNKKSFCAIIGTIVSMIITMLITFIVVWITHSEGIHYEEMEFLMTSPEEIFFVGIMIGTIGAIIDIAITMASCISELLVQNPNIKREALIKSSMEVGKDIMATNANTLVFVYISGSIPIILFWLLNGVSFSYILNIGISLEIIRALIGSIGVVISIPITLYISVLLLGKYKLGGVK
jgi:uncharacterized membrane protein